MNPFNYSLSEVSKALVALVGLVGYTLLVFFTFNPGIIVAVALMIPPIFTVIGVFAAKNHTPDDLQKAIVAAIGAIITVVNYFYKVPAGTENKLLLAVGALVVIIGIYWKKNSPPSPVVG